MTQSPTNFFSHIYRETRQILPGFLLASLIALAGQFISEHYGAPAMLMALLFGIALNFLSEEGQCVKGIDFSARTILRIGVALLGMRISFDMASQLGPKIIILVIASMGATILFGLLIARFFGQQNRFAFLSAGSVAICGASAAMAITAILPPDEKNEERLAFTVVGITVLSTLAMIIYPILASYLAYDEKLAGVFLGATIHDVAQVVGAGFSVSEQTGEVATVVKLIRVAMLAPVILVASLLIRRTHSTGKKSTSRPTLIPGFVLAFVALMVLNSFHLIPPLLTENSASLSRWALLTAIAGVGLKTSVREVAKVGTSAIALLVTETLFIATIMIVGIHFFA